MALFSSDTDENETNADTQSAEQAAENNQSSYRNDGKPAQRIDNSRSEVLVRPYITEKATYLTDDGVYTFVVKEDAHKPQIKQAVKDVYGVSVDKVRTAKLPKKQVESRAGQTGTKGGGKKAYIYLKEGDSIELM